MAKETGSKINKEILSHAVTLTAAFIANGDIRCGGSTRASSDEIARVKDMVTTLYGTLLSAVRTLEDSRP